MRSQSNWRYRVFKHYKHRAQKFMRNAITIEEKKAWEVVIKWFDSILRRGRFINKNGAIGIPRIKISDIIEEV